MIHAVQAALARFPSGEEPRCVKFVDFTGFFGPTRS